MQSQPASRKPAAGILALCSNIRLPAAMVPPPQSRTTEETQKIFEASLAVFARLGAAPHNRIRYQRWSP
jgi:hypothetical protein